MKKYNESTALISWPQTLSVIVKDAIRFLKLIAYEKLCICFLVLFLISTSCNEDDNIKLRNNLALKRIQNTSINQEPQLVPVLNSIGFFQSGRTQFSDTRSGGAGFQIDVNEIVKVLQGDSTRNIYTFKIDDPELNSKSFSNLIIEELEEGYLGYILEYDSDLPTNGFSNFTGSLKRYDMEGTLLSEKRIVSGQMRDSGSSSGRVAQAAYCVKEINSFFECVEYGYKFDPDSQTYLFACLQVQAGIEIVLEPCEDGGGGGGGGGGSTGDMGGTYVPPTTGGSGQSGGGSGLPPGSETTIGVISENISEVLAERLLSNPSALVEIPCRQLPKWKDLSLSNCPANIKTKINQLQNDNNSIFDDWAIQTINGASGTIVNMDYFSVNVSTLPKNPQTGLTFTPQGLLDHIRRNMNSFVEGTTFSPYCEVPSICTQETALWNSANPTGALIYIDIPGDDGVVVCSNYTVSNWDFMTLEAPGAGNHPVSGTRQFGFESNGTGGYNFFARGVDRFDSNVIENLAYIKFTGNPFEGADALWTSFQKKINTFVNNNGGRSSINASVKYRPDWDKVKEVLEGKRPISDLGCK